jgi:hypothetical protein
VFQNYTDKIEWGVVHNKSSKNVHINMCPEKLPLWGWSSACVQPTFSPYSSGDPPWALSCCHRVCRHCSAEYVQLSQSPWSFRSQSNMNRYTFVELSDMHLVYGEARGNGREAQRIYQECYSQRQLPHRTTFASIDRRLREYGSLEINKRTAGRPGLFEHHIWKRPC